MKKLTSILALLVALTPAFVSAQSLTLKWTSDTTLRVPESVLHDAKNNILYVANINGAPDGKDGNGFISKLGVDGKITSLEWVKGLDAPKGMGIVKNSLYVADITNVVVIDITTGKITATIPVEGSQFLNDITVDAAGVVYISDSSTGKIHVLKNNKVELYFEDAQIKGPNGLLALKDGLYIADFPTGVNYKLSASKQLTKFTTTAEGGDGVISLGADGYLVSSWYGQIDYVSPTGVVKTLLDTKAQKISSADIGYDPKRKTVYVPTFFKNGVTAYTFAK